MAISAEQWEAAAQDLRKSVAELQSEIEELDRRLGPQMPEIDLYRDRQGDPCTLAIWATLSEAHSYHFVAEAEMPSGLWVATIWLGVVDPIDGTLFESTVFKEKPPWPNGARRLAEQQYDTEAKALEGHAALVAAWSGR